MRLKEIEFKDRDNTDARHPGKARFKWNFNSTSRFPQRYTAGEHVREINFLFTSYSQRIRERKINRQFLHRSITIYLASKHIRVRSIRHDVDRQDKFSFSFYDERRALNNAGEINPCHELRTRRLKGLKKKKKRKKGKRNGGMVEQRKIGTLVISKFDGQLPKNVALGAKGSPLARYYRKCTVTG